MRLAKNKGADWSGAYTQWHEAANGSEERSLRDTKELLNVLGADREPGCACLLPILRGGTGNLQHKLRNERCES